MRVIKRKILFSMGIIFILLTGVLIKNIKSGDSLTIDQVITNHKQDTEVDLEFIESSKMALNNKPIKNADDYFMLAYFDYLTDNQASAMNYIKLCLQYMDAKTHPIAKIYSHQVLTEEMIKQNKVEEAINYVSQGFESIDKKDYPQYYKDIWRLIKVTIDSNHGRTIAIQSLEMMNQTNGKDNKEMLYYNTLKLVPLYGMSMKYSDAIQATLTGIDLAKELNDTNQNKLIIDLAIIFRLVGQYDIAEKTLEVVLENLQDTELNNPFIRIYALINLAEIKLIRNEHDVIQDIADEIEKCELLLGTDRANDYSIMRNLVIAQTMIEEDNYEQAKKHIEIAQQILAIDETSSVIDKDIYLMLTQAELYEKQGQYDQAIKGFHEALKLAEDRDNIEEQKSAMKSLIRIYKELNDVESQLHLQEKLTRIISEEQNQISLDYIIYTLQSHHNEKMIQENVKYQITIIVMIGAVIIISFVVTKKAITLLYLSHKDHLTGTNNRRRFDKLYGYLMRKKKAEFFIIMFDIDNFKQLNDSYGHDVGDLVLINLCKSIKEVLGRKDHLFRYGGEEFIVLTQNKNKSAVYDLSERMRQKIEQMKLDNGISVTISIGVASSIDEGEQTLKKADQNLYHSKTTGKNKVTI